MEPQIVGADEIGLGVYLLLDRIVDGNRAVGLHVWKTRFELRFGGGSVC
ncbi:MAG: hypothetical protein ACU0CO_01335 [Shimia sp.]